MIFMRTVCKYLREKNSKMYKSQSLCISRPKRILSLFQTNENCPFFQRTPLHHITQNAIIAHTSQFYRLYITRL